MAVAHVGELADHMEQIDEELGLSGRRLSGATDRRHSGWSNNQTATASHALLSSSSAAPAAQFDASSSQVEPSFFFFFSFFPFNRTFGPSAQWIFSYFVDRTTRRGAGQTITHEHPEVRKRLGSFESLGA